MKDGPTIKGRGVAYNSAWNFAGSGVALTVGLITVPIYLAALGLERFGILAILQALLAPMAVLNAGVTNSTVKYVASYVSAGAMDRARQAIAGALLVNFAIGLLGAGVFFLAAPYFLGFGFKISPELLEDAEDALRLMGAVWFVSQIRANFRGVIEGLRDQRRVAMGDALNTVTIAILCTAAALVFGKLSWFIAAQLTAVSISMAVFWWQSSKAMRGLSMSIGNALTGLRDVYNYSLWSVVNAAVATVANVADKYIIGIALSAATLGAYSVAQRLQNIARIQFYAVRSALFPAASAASSREGGAEILVIGTARKVSLLAGTVLAITAAASPAFVRSWVGAEIADLVSLALRIMIFKLIFEIPSAFGSSYLEATGKMRLMAYNNAVTTLITLALMIPLGIRYGLPGIALGSAIGMLLTRLPFHLWLYRQHFDQFISFREFFLSLYGFGAVCCLAGVVASFAIDLVPTNLGAWPSFILALIVAAAIVSAIVLLLVVGLLGEGPRLRDEALVVYGRITQRLGGSKPLVPID